MSSRRNTLHQQNKVPPNTREWSFQRQRKLKAIHCNMIALFRETYSHGIRVHDTAFGRVTRTRSPATQKDASFRYPGKSFAEKARETSPRFSRETWVYQRFDKAKNLE